MIKGDTNCEFAIITTVLFDYLSECQCYYTTEKVWDDFWSELVSTAYWSVVAGSER